MRYVGFGLACLLLGGCGNKEDQQKIEFASSTVQHALESWKAGSQPAELREGAAPVEFHDDDWERSAKLLDFEILNTYVEPSDGSARCTVMLTVKQDGRTSVQVKCTYQVITEPHVIVARDPMA